jgi:hypothetical protein
VHRVGAALLGLATLVILLASVAHAERPVPATTVRITVRVGTHCAQSTTGLRPTKNALVYP